jgi:F-type H+-transporting ATPase subunit gamma
MASLRDIRKRIKSVKNTQKITKAMKMVAAAKLRRAQEAAAAAQHYADGYRHLVQSLAAMVDAGDHKLLAERPDAQRATVIVLTSSRGLCGGFNSNLLKQLGRFMAAEGAAYDEVSVVTIGSKGAGHVARRYQHEADLTSAFIDGDEVEESRQLIQRLAQSFVAGELDHVYVLYNRFVSVMTQEPTLTRMLPTQLPEEAEDLEVQVLIEPDSQTLLDHVLEQQLFLTLYQAVLDTEAGEHASRMTAMDGATKNAGEMIDKMTLIYNRARQAAITSELVEIISGAEAL